MINSLTNKQFAGGKTLRKRLAKLTKRRQMYELTTRKQGYTIPGSMVK
jgi:hypothetical protein